ncbi:hypothetical protein O181_020529 [Austropuccinia psidii MF-1]|uniref:Uncharacterized protein n=1 Tax=Austropuccinia psidii MF-1 TaxID=1389203 RepID=A0A9Q3CBF4_9BASI|nr:hypothetical protein [Austropuccinia psidii MF-1]
MEEPFAHPATPTSVIIIDDAPIGSLPPLLPRRSQPSPPPWRQAPLITTMRLSRNLHTCNQPSSFLKKLSTNQSTKSCWSITNCYT